MTRSLYPFRIKISLDKALLLIYFCQKSSHVKVRSTYGAALPVHIICRQIRLTDRKKGFSDMNCGSSLYGSPERMKNMENTYKVPCLYQALQEADAEWKKEESSWQ